MNARGNAAFDRWRYWMAMLWLSHPWTFVTTNQGRLSTLAAPFAQLGLSADNDNSPQFPLLP